MHKGYLLFRPAGETIPFGSRQAAHCDGTSDRERERLVMGFVEFKSSIP